MIAVGGMVTAKLQEKLARRKCSFGDPDIASISLGEL
jgi:hypothetical protein